ncbi:MMPL family transporter, partial [Gordonia sp. (in: high G+C Gram-positive bacteria)]|uniref:MMPL family transporter n=1 Tax=Gordonia sp. (in: high G+C Gram-positive bacteria) TaxID=84139 RepID=UPI0026209FE2
MLTSTTQRSRKRLVTTAVVLLLAVTGVLLLPSTIARLGSGGMTADSAESVRAERLLKDRFPAADPDVVLLLTPAGGDSAAARRVLDAVAKRPEVTQVHSSFTDLPVDELRSGDTGLAFVTVRPGTSPADLLTIVDDARDTGHARDVTVTASGNGVIDGSIDAIAEASLVRAELIAAPLVGLILVVVFGSLWAALMPLVAGGAAVAIAMLGLSVLARVTEVSTFALNLATAIGFGLAVDYSLFIIARWREGRMLGMSAEEARALTIRTSGRTIVFSGVTVVIAMAALLVFPGYFLKSLAYSGILTVTTVMVVTVLIVPWMLV